MRTLTVPTTSVMGDEWDTCIDNTCDPPHHQYWPLTLPGTGGTLAPGPLLHRGRHKQNNFLLTPGSDRTLWRQGVCRHHSGLGYNPLFSHCRRLSGPYRWRNPTGAIYRLFYSRVILLTQGVVLGREVPSQRAPLLCQREGRG